MVVCVWGWKGTRFKSENVNVRTIWMKLWCNQENGFMDEINHTIVIGRWSFEWISNKSLMVILIVLFLNFGIHEINFNPCFVLNFMNMKYDSFIFKFIHIQSHFLINSTPSMLSTSPIWSNTFVWLISSIVKFYSHGQLHVWLVYSMHSTILFLTTRFLSCLKFMQI